MNVIFPPHIMYTKKIYEAFDDLVTRFLEGFSRDKLRSKVYVGGEIRGSMGNNNVTTEVNNVSTTTGYLSYLNERMKMKLFIQLAHMVRIGSKVGSPSIPTHWDRS